MKRLGLFLLAVLMVAGLAGCVTSRTEILTQKSYEIDSIRSSTIGDPMIIDQSGYVTKTKEWVGKLRSEDGWEYTERYSSDYLRKELVYSGKSGNVIEIAYREYRGGLAAPAFFQNVKYDLGESQTITFQKYKIQITEATNQSISFKVISD